MRAARWLTVCLLATTGCIRADVFVFRPKPAAEGAGDLMKKSKVPEHLRQELVDEITSDDGVKVSAWLLAHDAEDGTPTARHGLGVLYCHGNNNHIGTTVDRLDALWSLGYTVLAFDARGYGKTVAAHGQTQTGVFADARASRDYFVSRTDLGMAPERIGLYGRSLGSAICMHVATTTATPALILESPIGALQTMIDDSSSMDTPMDWWIDSTMDNGAMVEGFEGALLVMHGVEDDYVNPDYGVDIFERAKKARYSKMWLVPDADHGDVPCPKQRIKNDGGEMCAEGPSAEWTEETTAFFDAMLQ